MWIRSLAFLRVGISREQATPSFVLYLDQRPEMAIMIQKTEQRCVKYNYWLQHFRKNYITINASSTNPFIARQSEGISSMWVLKYCDRSEFFRYQKLWRFESGYAFNPVLMTVARLKFKICCHCDFIDCLYWL